MHFCLLINRCLFYNYQYNIKLQICCLHVVKKKITIQPVRAFLSKSDHFDKRLPTWLCITEPTKV